MVRRAHVFGVVALCLCIGGVVGSTSGLSVTAEPAGQTDAITEPAEPLSTADGFSRSTFRLTVYANGSVRWTTIYARPLNDSEVDEFRTFADEFNSTETELYREFVTQAESLADLGNQSTNRTTHARSFQKVAYVEERGFNLDSQGKVEMSFLWTNLSRVEGSQVILGDAFEGGLYLGPEQRLEITPGPSLVFDDAVPEPDSMSDSTSIQRSDTILYQGEYQFGDEKPEIRLVPQATQTTTTQPPTTTQTTTEVQTTAAMTTPATTEANGGVDETLLIVGVIVLLLGAGTAAVYRTVGSSGDDGGAAAAESASPPDEPGTDVDSAGAAAGESTVAEEELLTDTDRVHSLLESQGGRMRQSEIVEETDWSKSKVSMLLSDMEDEDEITKLRVGRENIISLPGKEPDAAGSPFEDED